MEYALNSRIVKEAFDYTPGPIVDCSVDGKPGYKANYENCKCYVFEPGDDLSEKEARRKATVQDYHKQRRKRITGSVKEAIPFFTTDGKDSSTLLNPPTGVETTAADGQAGEASVKPDGVYDGVIPGAQIDTTGDSGTNNSALSAAYGSKKSNKEQNMLGIDSIVRLARQAVDDVQWFDGTSNSIYNRLATLQEVVDEIKKIASSNIDDLSLDKLSTTLVQLQAEKDQLQKVAADYVDFDTEEYLQTLPGGTIASNYRLASTGTMDLGEDDGSLLYRLAKDVEAEVSSADWINFVTAGAEMWVEDQNNYMISDSVSTRVAASYYVEDKTLPILDVEKRAAIIDNFLTNVEICRREKAAKVAAKEENMQREASKPVRYAVDEVLGSTANWF